MRGVVLQVNIHMQSVDQNELNGIFNVMTVYHEKYFMFTKNPYSLT